MRNQPATGIDDVRFPTDVDLRHHVPHEFEIDVSNDRTLPPRSGDRNRHVGLGLLAEIDLAEIGLPDARRRTPDRPSSPCRAGRIQAETRDVGQLVTIRIDQLAPAIAGPGAAAGLNSSAGPPVPAKLLACGNVSQVIWRSISWRIARSALLRRAPFPAAADRGSRRSSR